jgi:peptidyl-prolyl cis-trans isomerase A (cyclophilin A)
MAKRRRRRDAHDEELEAALEDTTTERRRGGSSSSKRQISRRRQERIAQAEMARRAKRLRYTGLVVLIVAIVVIASLGAWYFFKPEGPKGNSIVVMETNRGDIEIEIYEDKTPDTAGNFLKLVDEDFYDGLTFHRVIEDFMIQGGDPEGTGAGGPGYQIPDEPAALALEHDYGVISMANSGPDSGGSQFFIVTNLDGSHHLNGKHAVFGKVVKGMDVAVAISKLDNNGDERPDSSVVMRKVYVKD